MSATCGSVIKGGSSSPDEDGCSCDGFSSITVGTPSLSALLKPKSSRISAKTALALLISRRILLHVLFEIVNSLFAFGSAMSFNLSLHI